MDDVATRLARRLLDAVQQAHYSKPQWVCVRELYDPETGRRADLACWNLVDGRFAVTEAKVFRGDWLNELKQPEKLRAFVGHATEIWVAAPVDVVRSHEVPDPFGFYQVGEAGVVRAPGRRLDGQPSAALARRFLKRALSDDTLRDLLAQERAAGLAAGKNKAAQARPAATYTYKDIKNAEARGENKAWAAARAKIRKAEGGMS